MKLTAGPLIDDNLSAFKAGQKPGRGSGSLHQPLSADHGFESACPYIISPILARRPQHSDGDQPLEYRHRRSNEESTVRHRSASTSGAVDLFRHRHAQILMECHEPILVESLFKQRALHSTTVSRYRRWIARYFRVSYVLATTLRCSVSDLKANANCPNTLQFQRHLLSHELSSFQGACCVAV
jgi:hypothetical protein